MIYDYTFMESPHHALDVIADLIRFEASPEEQDAWLKAVIKLGFVENMKLEEE